MILHDNQYAAFMMDFASGNLSTGERLAAHLHFTLSGSGALSRRVLDSVGGSLLEAAGEQKLSREFLSDAPFGVDGEADGDDDDVMSRAVAHYANSDLTKLKWRRSLLGMLERQTEFETASLLRLDPGQKAPRHGHGKSDVTVVLCGAFADEFGVYEKGALAFSYPGLKHQPEAIGDETCICLLASPDGRPLTGVGDLITSSRFWPFGKSKH